MVTTSNTGINLRHRFVTVDFLLVAQSCCILLEDPAEVNRRSASLKQGNISPKFPVRAGFLPGGIYALTAQTGTIPACNRFCEASGVDKTGERAKNKTIFLRMKY